MSFLKRSLSFRPMPSNWFRPQKYFSSKEVPEIITGESFEEGWKNWKYGELPFDKIRDSSDFSKFVNNYMNNADFIIHGNLPSNFRHIESSTVEKCIEILSKQLNEARKQRLNTVIQNRTSSVRFVFEQPHNPNNVWAALRTLDSFGIQFADIISGNDCPRATEMKGAALGSQKWMSIHQHDSLEFIQQLKNDGWVVVATDLHSKSIPFHSLKNSIDSSLPKPGSGSPVQVVVVMGNEFHGISPEMRNLADHLIFLPMKGFAESFNLSVATAVLCANLEQQNFLIPNLSSTQKNRLLFCWYLKNIGRSNAILKENGIEAFQ